jgi:hypothetical protein
VDEPLGGRWPIAPLCPSCSSIHPLVQSSLTDAVFTINCDGSPIHKVSHHSIASFFKGQCWHLFPMCMCMCIHYCACAYCIVAVYAFFTLSPIMFSAVPERGELWAEYYFLQNGFISQLNINCKLFYCETLYGQ